MKCVFEMPVDPAAASAAPQENNVDASPAIHEEKSKRIADGAKSSPKVSLNIYSPIRIAFFKRIYHFIPIYVLELI